MSTTNPYQAPQHQAVEVQVAKSDFPLATLWQRLAGSIIDTLILVIVFFAIAIPLMFVYSIILNPDYIDAPESTSQDSIAETIISYGGFVVAFLLLNGYLLSTRQQTIGKVLMKTKIVGDSSDFVSFSRLFLMRYLLVWIVTSIPIVGGFFSLINVITIFGEQRKCLHDKIAKTRVVSIR